MSDLSSFPRLITSVKYVKSDLEDGKNTSQLELDENPLDEVDLTGSITGLLARKPDRLEQVGVNSSGFFVHEIAGDLPWNLRDKAFNREISFPNLVQDIIEFAKRVQTNGSFIEFDQKLSKIKNLESSLETSRKELQTFKKSFWSKDLSAFEMFYSPYAQNDYFTSADEEFDSWGWDEYTSQYPRPTDASFDSDEYRAWEAGYRAAIRKLAPPYSYGTKPIVWPGINADQLIEQFEDDGDAHVWDVLEASLENYHEDAIEGVVDGDILEGLVHEWMKASTDARDDQTLREAINAWNLKQSIVSYYADKKVSVPNFHDANREEAEQWLKDMIKGKEKDIIDAKQRWLDQSIGCTSNPAI